MGAVAKRPTIELEAVRRLWLRQQGLLSPRRDKLTKRRFVDHLERTGGLQLDSVNVLDRAHYLTLWSRFGAYNRVFPDRWTYRDRAAYEYLGHEACLLPWSRLPISLRAMRRYAPRGKWWEALKPPLAVKRKVLARIRKEGPLESADFEHGDRVEFSGWSWKAAKRALEVHWRQGRLATQDRRHFRRVYELAEKVYGDAAPASLSEYEDSWALLGLRGNGIARESHLSGYMTSPRLPAADKRKVITRLLRQKKIRRVAVRGFDGDFLALPEHLDELEGLEAPRGTTLVCPFDSLLWQRDRAEELLDFHYRIEIYVPAPKRRYGYYVLPILHDGRLVGRLDPKLHRDEGVLEIRALHLEEGFDGGRAFEAGLAETLEDLRRFTGAEELRLPAGVRLRGSSRSV